ncbi:MAG TPA: DMT family transporter [Rhodocyclaceae bacterium]|jgi:drug/metabolite transporter (DMT)-like permease|nr:DMT family transporter [Rhodocyclaceae bacterium]
MAGRDKTVALLALLTGAIVWGMIWYPYRIFERVGLPGLHASILSYLVALGLGCIFLRAHLRGGFSWKLLLIGLCAGACNLGYVLATLHGEVMRVLLLFYLAPLWTVFLSRLLLGERLSLAGGAVVVLSLGGAVTMLWRPEIGAPWPGNGAEWTGMAAGFLFALSNVLVRQTTHLTIERKSLAVFLGVVVLGLLITPFEALPGARGELRMEGWHWAVLILVGVILYLINLIVQYGLTRTAANQAVVIFLFELVVAALSSWLLAGEVMGLQEWLGGAMIIGASLFSGKLGAAEGHSAQSP